MSKVFKKNTANQFLRNAKAKKLIAHVCDRCGIESSPVLKIYGEYLPQGWSHMTYVVPAMQHGKLPGALEDNKEYDFCFDCSQQILIIRANY